MARFRHIIWDWNGTLFDDAWLCIEIINDLLARRQMPTVTGAEFAATFTFPVVEFYRAVGFDFVREPFEKLAEEFITLYDRRSRECRLQPGAREVLQALAARGSRQSVLSACEQTRLNEMIAFFGIQGYFDRLAGQEDFYSAGKIARGRRLVADMNCAPAEMLLIGDSPHDAEVAEAMGIACALIPGGHISRDRLLAHGAPVLETLHDVLDYTMVTA